MQLTEVEVDTFNFWPSTPYHPVVAAKMIEFAEQHADFAAYKVRRTKKKVARG
jgi:hypothetical protein